MEVSGGSEDSLEIQKVAGEDPEVQGLLGTVQVPLEAGPAASLGVLGQTVPEAIAPLAVLDEARELLVLLAVLGETVVSLEGIVPVEES